MKFEKLVKRLPKVEHKYLLQYSAWAKTSVGLTYVVKIARTQQMAQVNQNSNMVFNSP